MSWFSSSSSGDPQDTQKTLGLTSAISTAKPQEQDLILTKELEEVISEYDAFEPESEMNHRLQVLATINTLVNEWILEMSLARNMPQEIAENVGGRIYTFGSFRLGVHSRNADIDALCVAPRHIERSDFFKSFYDKLKAHPEVTDLRAVEEAFVPVLKMNFGGIEVDLLFARLALREIPVEIDLKDDTVLKNLDPRCVRSLNGCRVTDEILDLVPNIETFRTALRAIKVWAKQHGIYSNILGYLGGVSWAILVARTCQLYPNAVAGTIVHKFFLVFSNWQWPLPILLKKNDTNTSNRLDFPVWDPKVNVADRDHMMPIITPSYPQQNSTYNVSLSTRTIICETLGQGFKISEEIMMGRVKWPLLFEKPNFFSEYRHFILLVASSGTKAEHLEWHGLVEAKVRHLVNILERNKYIKLVHPNPEIFELKKDYINEENDGENGQECSERPNSVWVVGIKFHKVTSAISINLTTEIQNFTNAVMKHALGIKMWKESMRMRALYVKKKAINTYLSEEVLERDRPIAEIMAGIPENSATIMLRKRTLDETPPGNSAAAGVKRKKLNNESSPFRKVNTVNIKDSTKLEEAKPSSPENRLVTSTRPISSPPSNGDVITISDNEEDTTTSQTEEDEIISIHSDDDT